MLVVALLVGKTSERVRGYKEISTELLEQRVWQIDLVSPISIYFVHNRLFSQQFMIIHDHLNTNSEFILIVICLKSACLWPISYILLIY